MQVVVNNILTNYQKVGSGPIILLLHGWGDNSKTFSQLTTKLKTDFTCVSVDLPGSGESSLPEKPWGVEDYAGFVATFTRKIDIKPDFLIGHSNGGTISTYLVSHDLLIPKKLILLASAGIRSEDGLKKSSFKAVAKTGKHVSRLLPKSLQQKLKGKLYRAAGSDMLIVPELEETFKKVVSYDAQADAKLVDIPTLLIYAQDDTATPPRYGEKFESLIPNAKFKQLTNGGHHLHQTQAEDVANIALGFFK